MDFRGELAAAEADLEACSGFLDGIHKTKASARSMRSEEKAASKLRSADVRLGSALTLSGEGDCELLGTMLAWEVKLASGLGELELVRRAAERIMCLPSTGKGALRKLEAGAVLISDCSLCCDFDSALAVLTDLKKHACGRTNAGLWLASASRLAGSLAEAGRTGDALEVSSAMRSFRRWEASRLARAQAAAKIVAGLKLRGDLEGAFAVFREMASYATGPEPFRLYMRAGLSLLPALSRSPEQEGRCSFLARALLDPSESPEESVLRGEAALSYVEDCTREGLLDEAMVVLEAFGDFSGSELVAVHRSKAVAAVAEGYMDAMRLDEAQALLEGQASRGRASAGPGDGPPVQGPAECGSRNRSAEAGETRLAYAALFPAILRLVSELDDCMCEEDARSFCRAVAGAAPDERDALAFAEAALEAVEDRCRSGQALEALGLYRALAPKDGPEPLMFVTCRMGAAVVRSLSGMGFVAEAEELLAALPGPRRPGDRIYYERLQAETDTFTALLTVGLYGRAAKLFKRRSDFRGPKKAAQRWLKAAGKLVESFADEGSVTKARSVFEHARRESPKGGKFTLNLFAMAQDIITGYCEKGELKSARELFDSLPGAGGSSRLEEEKAEISFFLTLNYCRKGEITDALGFFASLPEASPTGKLPFLKARTAAWLIAELSGRGFAEEAASVYESLAGLGSADGLELVRAKSAIRLVTAFTQSEHTGRALELLKTVPSFCDPKRVGRQLGAAVRALSLVMAKKSEVDKANELRSFTMKFL
ncbi:MAG: hypothetical protein LBQ79_00670 [Deltaproteobacteria bacterium]|jgi:tetratricopeptide (TPR) repeat protein|nr:hypothetical protein [Deltaproteobacteria bacterium]